MGYKIVLVFDVDGDCRDEAVDAVHEWVEERADKEDEWPDGMNSCCVVHDFALGRSNERIVNVDNDDVDEEDVEEDTDVG